MCICMYVYMYICNICIYVYIVFFEGWQLHIVVIMFLFFTKNYS